MTCPLCCDVHDLRRSEKRPRFLVPFAESLESWAKGRIPVSHCRSRRQTDVSSKYRLVGPSVSRTPALLGPVCQGHAKCP